jgi:two-component system, cell cycle response regulator
MNQEKSWGERAEFPVLVAEDNDITRKYLQKILSRAGFRVEATNTGQKALEIFNNSFFPILLTDWMMPEMNGLELCKTVRKQANKGYVFIVLLTGRDKKEDIITGLEAGADEYITKPINYAELLARLSSGIRILELERSLRDANEKIKILTITDPLTGCFNRGYMTGKLAQELKRAQRYHHPLSLIFSDLDHFKQVNDTYGHQAGDLVLKEFSRCILGLIRADVDWLARYGGEEFLLVLPETKLEGAYKMAERIRHTISQCEMKWRGKVIRLTASFGVTGIGGSMSNQEVSPEILIQQADKSLYQSKREGRNRVSVTPL